MVLLAMIGSVNWVLALSTGLLFVTLLLMRQHTFSGSMLYRACFLGCKKPSDEEVETLVRERVETLRDEMCELSAFLAAERWKAVGLTENHVIVVPDDEEEKNSGE